MYIIDGNKGKEEEDKLLTYDQWCLRQSQVTSRGAWEHQQKIIDQLNQGWEEAVMWGKDQLGDTIQKQNQALLTLQKEVNRLTGENHQLRKELDSLEVDSE